MEHEMLTEFDRMKLIGDEFPLPLVAPEVIAKVDAVALAVGRVVLETRAAPLTVRVAADGWGAVDADGNNVGGGCSLEGWLRAVRWTEKMHGLGA
jgi:hypothetical protein